MKYITLLRGINVGGNKKILMKDLVLLFEKAGAKEVITYIQSGNVVFANKQLDEKKWSEKISAQIKIQYGFEVAIITLSAEQLKGWFSKNPFQKTEPKLLHGVFFNEIPSIEKIALLPESNSKADEYLFDGNFMFLKCSGKYSDSKLTNSFLESKLKVTATTRNWQTISKLIELAQ